MISPVYLLEFTYPSTPVSSKYWNENLSEYEKGLWSTVVIESQADIVRAFSVLSGFDLLALKDQEFIIPSLVGSNASLKASVTNGNVDKPYTFVVEYLSLPSGFFERLVIRLSRLVSHLDMTSSAISIYSLGNVGSIFLCFDKVARLSISASAKALFDDIKAEVFKVELFFPGLFRIKMTQNDHSKLKDVAQVLIVGSSMSKVCNRLAAAISSKYPKLIIEKQADKSYRSEILDCRIAIVCIDKSIVKVPNAISCIKALYSSGTFLVPVIMEDYKITDYTHWWPSTIPELESHKLFVDLRFDFEGQVRENLLQVVMKNLEEWRGKRAPSSDTAEERIPCSQCIVDCCPVYCSFDISTCKGFVDDFYSLKLRVYEASSKGEANLLVHVPPIMCANGHEYDINKAMNQSVIKDTFPCPVCVRESSSDPFLFDRGELLIRFEDDVKKVGIISCPKCTSFGRSSTFRIVDLLNTDIFITYNWGIQKLTQKLIIPFVRKIELETDILCWFDIHGGLSAGQDHIQEMSIGVSKCSVFVVFLTDQYVISENCQREFIQCAKLGKYIIPLLLPSISIADGNSVGWTGSSSVRDYWKHAEALSAHMSDPDDKLSKFPWFILQNFEPIDLRTMTESEYMAVACEEVICRILTRLHRGRMVKAFDFSTVNSSLKDVPGCLSYA